MRVQLDSLWRKESIRAWKGGVEGRGSETKMPRVSSGSATSRKEPWPRECTASASSQGLRAAWGRHGTADTDAGTPAGGESWRGGWRYSLKLNGSSR